VFEGLREVLPIRRAVIPHGSATTATIQQTLLVPILAVLLRDLVGLLYMPASTPRPVALPMHLARRCIAMIRVFGRKLLSPCGQSPDRSDDSVASLPS